MTRLCAPLSSVALLTLLLFAAPAGAQRSLREYLSPQAKQAVSSAAARAEVDRALARLQNARVPRGALKNLLSSKKAAPYLSEALPRLADLQGVGGLAEVMDRMARGGQNGAYELAVAHAFKGQIKTASAMVGGSEVDGMLGSGTIVEAKSGRPKRPDHVLDQVRRRAAGGKKVVLALGYRPPDQDLTKLRALSRELGGRLQVAFLPLSGNKYELLIPGKGIQVPANRKPWKGPGKLTAPVPRYPGSLKPKNRPQHTGTLPAGTSAPATTFGETLKTPKTHKGKSQRRIPKTTGRTRARTPVRAPVRGQGPTPRPRRSGRR